VTQEAAFRHFILTRSDKIKQPEDEEIDFEHVETLDWDMSTYLKMLDHKEVDYKRAPSSDQLEPRFWYSIARVSISCWFSTAREQADAS
jgi:hypothetical protein